MNCSYKTIRRIRKWYLLCVVVFCTIADCGSGYIAIHLYNIQVSWHVVYDSPSSLDIFPLHTPLAIVHPRGVYSSSSVDATNTDEYINIFTCPKQTALLRLSVCVTRIFLSWIKIVRLLCLRVCGCTAFIINWKGTSIINAQLSGF